MHEDQSKIWKNQNIFLHITRKLEQVYCLDGVKLKPSTRSDTPSYN